MNIREIEALMIAYMHKFAALENQAMRASYAEERSCSYCGDTFRSAAAQRYCGSECSHDAALARSEAKAA